MMQMLKSKKGKLAGIILFTLMILTIGALNTYAAQAKLDFATSPSGAGSFKVYVNQRGKKTYLENKGGYYLINIPDGASLGTTVFFEVQPYNCFALRGLQSNDMKILTDEKGVKYYKFTAAKDNGQTRHVTAVFASNHQMTMIPKVEATCKKAGNKQYFKCSICGKYYSDQAGTKVTTPAKMAIKKKDHKWDKGVVTRKPTKETTGTIIYTCQYCRETKTKTIPKLYVDPISENAISPDNPASYDTVEKQILKTKYKKTIKNTTFGLLCLRGSSKSKTGTKLYWKKVPTAKKYVIFRAENGGKFRKLGTTTKKKYSVSGLKAAKYYQYMVVAVNGSKAVAVSTPVYIAPRAGKYVNVTKVDADKDVVSIRVGGTEVISAEATKAEGGYKQIRVLKYESSNMDVASVGKNGTIYGVGKGNCVIHVYAQDGIYDEVQVYVN